MPAWEAALLTSGLAIAGFGARNKIDFVALSFCRSGQDIKDARTYLDK